MGAVSSPYNEERLHEELGDLPPAEYEALATGKKERPFGPPEPGPPALSWSALAGLGGKVPAR